MKGERWRYDESKTELGQDNLISFDGKRREIRERIMSDIFDLEEDLDRKFGQLQSVLRNNSEARALAGSLRETVEQAMTLALQNADVRPEDYKSYVQARLESGQAKI